MPEKAETPIKRYKRTHGLTYPQVATRLGITCDYARKLGCGSVRRTSPSLAVRIEFRSGGEIRRQELVFPDGVV
jgi:hypothetical protein